MKFYTSLVGRLAINRARALVAILIPIMMFATTGGISLVIVLTANSSSSWNYLALILAALCPAITLDSLKLVRDAYRNSKSIRILVNFKPSTMSKSTFRRFLSQFLFQHKDIIFTTTDNSLSGNIVDEFLSELQKLKTE